MPWAMRSALTSSRVNSFGSIASRPTEPRCRALPKGMRSQPFQEKTVQALQRYVTIKCALSPDEGEIVEVKIHIYIEVIFI